jgi:phage-related protein
MTVIGEVFISVKSQDEFTPALTKAGQTAGSQAGDAAGKAVTGKFKSAMSSMAGSLRSAFGPALGPVGDLIDKMDGISNAASSMGSKTGASFVKMGGIATGVGVLMQGIGDREKIAQGQLANAVTNTGQSWSKYKDEMEKVEKSEAKYGYTSEDTAKALTSMVQKTGNVEGSMKNMSLVTDLAASRHMSLASAGNIVARIMNGNTRVLQQYGITQQELAKATNGSTDAHVKGAAAVQILSERLKGQADVAANTFTGRMKEVRATLENVAATVSQHVGPVLTALGPTMMGVGAIIESGMLGKLKKIGPAVMDSVNGIKKVAMAVKEWTAVQWLLDAATSPMLLIPLAIAAVVAAFVIAYIKIKPFRDVINDIGKAIKTAFLDSINAVVIAFKAFVAFFENLWKMVTDIVKKYGLFILAAVAPIIGIPLLIITHWNQIIGFMSNLWNTIWNTVTHFTSSIINTIANFWSTVVNFFKRLVNDATSAMAALPGRVAGAIAGLVGAVVNIVSQMWHSAVSAVQSFVSDAASAAGQLVGRIVSALSGLGGAVRGAVSAAFSGIRGIVTGAFGDAASWLYDIGASIIQGLINGIKSAIGGIGSAVSGIGGLIKKLKGPLPKDLTLLTEEGQAIIQGLINGINSRVPHLTQAMQGVTGNIKLGATPATAGVPAGVNGAAAGIGGYTFFPNATINMAEESPAELVSRMSWAVQTSRM